MKPHDPRGRASAALHCLRCGQPGHFAGNCPVPAKTGTKRPATEAVAQMEDAHVTFMDFKGHERYDVAMLGPGASAFLSGFGPARRYLQFLESQGDPIQDVQFHRCRHKFHLGGDGECWSNWVMQLRMCIAGRYGQAQVFLHKGETPLPCGRPIIESLGVVMDFQNKKVRMGSGLWRSATI